MYYIINFEFIDNEKGGLTVHVIKYIEDGEKL